MLKNVQSNLEKRSLTYHSRIDSTTSRYQLQPVEPRNTINQTPPSETTQPPWISVHLGSRMQGHQNQIWVQQHKPCECTGCVLLRVPHSIPWVNWSQNLQVISKAILLYLFNMMIYNSELKKKVLVTREKVEMFMFILFWRKQSSAFISSECLWVCDYICATRFPCNSASCFPQTIKNPQTACQVVIVPWPPLATKFEATEKFWQLLWNDVTNHFHVLTFKV